MNQKLSGFVYGVDASSMFSQAMSLLQKGLIAVGAFLMLMLALSNLSTNIKDGGPGVRNAILRNCWWGHGGSRWCFCDTDYHLGEDST